ncbi:MAG: FAD:protein FMN transferase [Terriglobales bacterium]
MRWNKQLAAFLLCVSASLASAQTSPPQTSPPQTSPSHDRFVHQKKYVMGTVFEIVAYSPNGETPARTSYAVDRAFGEIVRLDNVMSDYKAESALSRLNRSSHSRPEPVPSDLYCVIGDALRYSRLSGGKFDVTVGPLVKLWKAAIRGGPAPSAAEEEKVRSCVGYQKVELLPPNLVQFQSPCVQIDLGAIGKGYALDQAAAVLRSHGISRALLDAGGSTMVAMGPPPGQQGWLVHLRDPSSKVDPVVMLSDSSVSTSEQTPASLLSPEPAGHIIDPDKGVPVKAPFAVSVVAGSGTASDALSTTLLLLGPEKGKELVKSQPGVAAIWISGDGRSELVSSGPRLLINGAAQGPSTSARTTQGGLR